MNSLIRFAYELKLPSLEYTGIFSESIFKFTQFWPKNCNPVNPVINCSVCCNSSAGDIHGASLRQRDSLPSGILFVLDVVPTSDH